MTPDDARVRLPRESLDAVRWYDGEAIRSVWPTGPDYLVVTTLRCIVLEHGDGLRRPAGWRAGAEFAFFNFAEPSVRGVDEVELSEEFFDDRRLRLPVADPVSVCAALSAARSEGRVAWILRRSMTASTEAPPPRPRGLVRPAGEESTPCAACGNVYRGSVQFCPACHVPTGPRRRR